MKNTGGVGILSVVRVPHFDEFWKEEAHGCAPLLMFILPCCIFQAFSLSL
jgi:hypothetical protein